MKNKHNKSMQKTRKKSIRRKSLSIGVYNETDYNSNDGMLTSVWGPGMWHYLHTMSFNYPVHPTKQDKRHYRDFMMNLRYVLPCGKCRVNLRENYKKLPLTMARLKNRDTFSRYVFDLHELINTMLNKKSGLTYEEVRERYEHFRARCTVSSIMSKTKRNKTQKKVHFSKILSRTSTESGCTDPLYGEKSKCVLHIVPQHTQCESLHIDKQCIKEKQQVVNALTTATNK
jgi:hypothetical protein